MITRTSREAARGATLFAARRELVAGLTGTIVDLGVGSWPTLPFYGGSARLVGVDPSPWQIHHGQQMAAYARSGQARVVRGSADRLPFQTGAVDHVVVSLVLCSVASVDAALVEVKRVLRPGGTLAFLEHIPLPGWRGLTQRFAHLAPGRGDGCHQRRDPVAAIAAHFDRVTYTERTAERDDRTPVRVVVGRAH